MGAGFGRLWGDCKIDHHIGVQAMSSRIQGHCSEDDPAARGFVGKGAAREKDLHLHPSACFSWVGNGTTTVKGGGVWVGTGRNRGKNKSKIFPVLPKIRAKTSFCEKPVP